MPFAVLYIGEPTRITHAYVFVPLFINYQLGGRGIFVWDAKFSPRETGCANPYLVFLYERKNFLVGYGVHVSYYEEFFLRFNYPRHKFSEQRERRICYYDIGFIAQASHFVAIKIAVAFKIVPLKIIEVYFAVARNVVVKNK